MHYNLFTMGLSSDVMLLLLLLAALGIALIAAFYLRRRTLSLPEYLAWGALLVFVPFLGPFLIIVLRPGRPT
jgi:hypothetical protein